MRQLTADAPGKLILLGEYAVLEGSPALVGAVARRARVSCTASDPGEGLSLNSTMLEHPVPFKLDESGRVVFSRSLSREIQDRLGVFSATMKQAWSGIADRFSMDTAISVDTSAFFLEGLDRKLGLGSSAALTVALTAALYAWAGVMDTRVPDRKRLLKDAMSAHHQAQSNTGSGVDIAASVYGGVFRYTINGASGTTDVSMTPTHLPSDLEAVAVWTGRSASTPEMVGSVNRFKGHSPRQYAAFMEQMTELAVAGFHSLEQSDTMGFLELVSRYGDTMQELGNASNTPIISSEHAQIRDICTEAGLAYKPSGAGGGDLGILFASGDQDVTETLRKLEQAGYPAYDLQIGTHGVRAIVEQEG